MSKGRSFAFLLLVLLTTAAVASAQNGAGEVTHARITTRGVSFLQNVPAEAPRGPMKPPREADRKRDLIKAMRESMHAAAPNINLGRALASTNAGVVSGGT